MQLSPLSKVIPSFGAATLEGLDTSNLQEGQRIGGNKGRQFVRFYNKTYSIPVTVRAKINHKTGSAIPLEVEMRTVTREFVEIITPGDKNTVDDFAEDFHKREHFAKYQAFREGRTAPLGKSIDELAYINQHTATELRIMNIHTEEQLADASEVALGRIADGFLLRDYARTSVAASGGTETKEQVLILQSQVKEMAAIIEGLKSQSAIVAPVQTLSPAQKRAATIAAKAALANVREETNEA